MWWGLSLVSLGYYCFNFLKGYTVKEILERRLDTMQTTIFTVFLILGFQPFFLFLQKGLIFLKDVFLGCFFPEKKLKNLEIKYAKEVYRHELLLKKLATLQNQQQKLQQKILTQQHKVAQKKNQQTLKDTLVQKKELEEKKNE
ncbi:hypothetical protein [Candidatus Phytoplasma phoenicium]|uniref:Putative cell surface protein n=1 Tax=Candidatus Phytoplasma phoenicium TaxID=198422 RepID=A0A0L0MJA3_9MOLU|nr:hypothetical protein [Candidatus Phytoplasma phoenicium]KND62727.1 putative cell surface protein [Candidatus Phytoplasma phoenicium]